MGIPVIINDKGDKIYRTEQIGSTKDENDKAEWYWQYEIHYLKHPRFSFFETERDISLLMEEGKLEVLSKVETN